MNEQSLKPVIEKLESYFSMFNQKFYNGELQKPVITVSPDTTKGAYGWCTGWKAWKVADQAAETTKEDDGFYEINICAEYLSRPFEQTAETLLHEMVHLYNLQQGVQDTSRGGTYHNAKFKTAAEEHGLIVTKTPKYGWSSTELNDEALAYVNSLQDKSFQLFRKSATKTIGKGKSKQKQSSRKYVCPCCGTSVRATKEVSLICGSCFSPDSDPVYMEVEE